MSDNPSSKEAQRALKAVRARYNSAAMQGHADAEDLHTAVTLLERVVDAMPKPKRSTKKPATKKGRSNGR